VLALLLLPLLTLTQTLQPLLLLTLLLLLLLLTLLEREHARQPHVMDVHYMCRMLRGVHTIMATEPLARPLGHGTPPRA
jgi:hypothetical protein